MKKIFCFFNISFINKINMDFKNEKIILKTISNTATNPEFLRVTQVHSDFIERSLTHTLKKSFLEEKLHSKDFNYTQSDELSITYENSLNEHLNSQIINFPNLHFSTISDYIRANDSTGFDNFFNYDLPWHTGENLIDHFRDLFPNIDTIEVDFSNNTFFTDTSSNIDRSSQYTLNVADIDLDFSPPENPLTLYFNQHNLPLNVDELNEIVTQYHLNIYQQNILEIQNTISLIYKNIKILDLSTESFILLKNVDLEYPFSLINNLQGLNYKIWMYGDYTQSFQKNVTFLLQNKYFINADNINIILNYSYNFQELINLGVLVP